MSLQSVTIGGQNLGVIDVTTHSRGGDQLNAATIVTPDTDTVRSAATHGADVEIQWADYRWHGYVTNPRGGETAETLQIKALGKRLPLKHTSLHTVFYDINSSEAVKTAATTRSKPLDRVAIHTGSSVTDWTATAPVAELYAGSRAGLYNWGSDLLFLGARSGHTQPLYATYHSVPTDAVVDGIYQLNTRLLVNDQSDIWDVEVELTADDGTTYVWEPELDSTSFESLTLNAEDAHPDGEVAETGTLQYRFKPAAPVGSDTGIMIDNAHTLPFERVGRPSSLNVSGVVETNRKITRRVDEPAAVFLDKQAVEDGFSWWVDDDVLHYEPGSNDPGSLEIVAGATPVIDVDPDRDAEDIINVATVQGAGDIEVTEQDSASIAYYGPVPREQPVVDDNLTSEAEARARAQGILESEAWNDAEVPFEIADARFAALTYDDSIPVEWPLEGLSGEYSVAETRTQSNGVVTVTITASSGRGDY